MRKQPVCIYCSGNGFICNGKTEGLTRRCMYCNPPEYEFGMLIVPDSAESSTVQTGQVVETMAEAFEEIAEMLDETEIQQRFN